MSQILFYKMVASGNDFIVIDNRKRVIQDGKQFARNVCPAHLGVGADGVLLLEASENADLRLRIYNADGSEAEACGNGYRCVGFFAHQILGFPSSVTLETIAGQIKLVVNDNFVRVNMVEPTKYREHISVPLGEYVLNMASIDTGVPHAVIFTNDLESIDVATLGREIRRHSLFQPKGTNVNFVEVSGPHDLTIRTYERGVEEETLACGTGAAAAAIVSGLSGRTTAPVKIRVRSGETLTVDYQLNGRKIGRVVLEGDAKFVFEGKLFMTQQGLVSHQASGKGTSR